MPDRQHGERLFQFGDWWIAERGGTRNLQRCRYDPATGRVQRLSLGTADLQTAIARLVELTAAAAKPADPSPVAVPVAWCLLHYWDQHARHLTSATQARIELGYWTDWWGGRTVADVTRTACEAFIGHLRAAGKSDGYIHRILSSGRAALKLAHKDGHILAAPFVPDVQTAEDRRRSDPKGRPLQILEVARLLDSVVEEHLWRFCVLLICTMGRPGAVLDLGRSQIDRDGGFINLLPAGRRQNRKRRAIVPICDTLAGWLCRWPEERLVTWDGRPVRSIKTGWRALRQRAGLDSEVQPYSIRHTLGRYLRRQRVPGDEIALMLGHLPVDDSDVTRTYSPHDPDYCRSATAAIDKFCREVSLAQNRESPRRLGDALPAVRLVKEAR